MPIHTREIICIFSADVHSGGEERLRIDEERLQHWLSLGAQASDRVVSLRKDWRRAAKAAPAAPSPESSGPAGGDGAEEAA